MATETQNIKQLHIKQVSNNKEVTYGLGIPHYVKTTRLNLISLRNNGELEAGTWYRITDYVTQVSGTGYTSIAHAFDIIVLATSTSSLSETAFATQRESDTYFKNSNLDAWELKYCIDNDTDRFDWIDSTSRGAIYYMKDEFGNECPYDFKNIKVNGKFTFDCGTDQSLTSDCSNNVIRPYYSNGKQHLNEIVFNCGTNNSKTQGNYFGPNCHQIMLGGGCCNNHFEGGNCWIMFGTSTNYNSYTPSSITTKDFYTNNYFSLGVSCLAIYPKGTTSASKDVANLHFHHGVSGGTRTEGTTFHTDSSDPLLEIEVDVLSSTYEINYGVDSKGFLFIWGV